MDKSIDLEALMEAVRILGIEEETNINEIKAVYRKKSLKLHPDRCIQENKRESERKFKEMGNAYNLIISYCMTRRMSFKREDLVEDDPEKEFNEHMERYRFW